MSFRLTLISTTLITAVIAATNPALADAHRTGNALRVSQAKQTLGPNLAAGATLVASSVWSSDHLAAKAQDGNRASRWAATAANDQWLQLDLGQPRAVGTLILNEFESRITAFTLDYSVDGQHWQSAHHAGKPASKVDTVTRVDLAQPVLARYVRLQINAAADAPSLYELGVYAPSPARAGLAEPTASKAPALATLDAHDAKFSPATLQFLKTNTGLDGEQWDNIMQVVNKPEQDSLDWPKFYGYCENINDNRGYTIGIFGATTGGSNDTGPDGPALFKAFDAASGASSPSIIGGLTRAGAHGKMSGSILKITDSASVFCGKIKALQTNAAWRAAMWQTFYDVYIKYSVQQARKRNFNSAATIGAFVDAALNQGATGDSGSLEGMLSRSGSSSNEKTFMTSFFAQRTKIVDTNDYNLPPNGKNRVKQWSTLFNDGELDLKNADAEIIKVTKWQLK